MRPPKKPAAPLLNPWLALQANDGSTYIVGCKSISVAATLSSERKAFGEIRRWLVTPRVIMADSASTVIGCDGGVVFHLGHDQLEALPSRVKASLNFYLAILGLEDDSVPEEEIHAALEDADHG
jgi:hypothetical protein